MCQERKKERERERNKDIATIRFVSLLISNVLFSNLKEQSKILSTSSFEIKFTIDNSQNKSEQINFYIFVTLNN